MRPLNKLPYNEVSPVVKALGNAGFDERVAAEIRRKKGDAAEMMACYFLRKGWYLTPWEDQLRIMQEANTKLSWGIPLYRFTEFRRCRLDPSFGYSLQNAPVLVPLWREPNEAGYARAIKAMYQLFRLRLSTVCPFVPVHANEMVDEELKWSGDQIGDDLGWAFMDLTASNHVEEPDGRSLENSSPLEAKRLGLAALAAAAMHPIWVLAMDGERIPHIRIVGSGVTPPKVAWIRMYIKGWCGGRANEITVDTMDCSVPKPGFTVPKIHHFPNS